ncbi:blood stage membrane protein ag-1 [Plasmodium vivax Brazil I]|uniref:Blood stage membrane protein ag-1 n=1 Tax=Plasmodium vivax (strain Brazil I) TaxID=1033975 RepID=A0A0J9T217_PLAV1|nr:blood stage membrane protein ag-1 [Plasmodium vivax Brazil I]
MENIKTLYHIFSSADGSPVDGGDQKKCYKGIQDVEGAPLSEAAVVAPQKTHKKVSPEERAKRTNKEKELSSPFNHFPHFGEYTGAHSADVERRRSEREDRSFRQRGEVTPDWEALQHVDDPSESLAKEANDREGEMVGHSKGKMPRRGSHLRHHNGGEKKDASSSPTKGETSEQPKGRQSHMGGAVHLVREHNPTGEATQNGFVSPSKETLFYEAFASLSSQMANEGTHVDNPFRRNSNGGNLLNIEPQQSNREKVEPSLGGAKVMPLNWDRHDCTLIDLHASIPKEEGETSKGEPSPNEGLHPQWDFLKWDEATVQVERTEDPFLNLIGGGNFPEGVPFFEEHSSMGGSLSNEKDPIRMGDFHTGGVAPLGSENPFGELTSWSAMRGGGQAEGMTRDVQVNAQAEGQLRSNLFPLDGDYSPGGEANGGGFHTGGGSPVCGVNGDTAADEELMGRDNPVNNPHPHPHLHPHQWGKSLTGDPFHVVDSKRGGSTPPNSHMMKNPPTEEIKLHDELINLSDGPTSEMGLIGKGTPPRGEPSVGWLSLEEGNHMDCFHLMGEAKTEGGKSPLWGKHDFFNFEHDEEVGAPRRGSPDWVEDVSKGVVSSEEGAPKEGSHVGLFAATPHQIGGKEKATANANAEEEEDPALTYRYLTEQRMVEEAAPMEDEGSSFLDIIDEIVSISKDIIGTNQHEDGVLGIQQGGPNEGMNCLQFEGHPPGALQMGHPLSAAMGAMVEAAEKSTHEGVSNDPPEEKLLDDVYVHFDHLSESRRKGEDSSDEDVTANRREDSPCDAVHGNASRTYVDALQVAHPPWRNRSTETEDDAGGVKEEDPQESPSLRITPGWADPPTMQLCEGIYHVLMSRNYLEALPVLAAYRGEKQTDGRPISEVSDATHRGASNYLGDDSLHGKVNLLTFHTYLRRAKKMNKRGFDEMYDYSDYVYTHMDEIYQMDVSRFFFNSNYLENMNRYVIKKNRIVNDLTNAHNFVNDFLKKKENVITQKGFRTDVTYPMYFLMLTDLLVTLWRMSLSRLKEANWSKTIRFLTRRLRRKTTIRVLKRCHSLLSRIYRHLTKHPLDERQKKKIIKTVKRSRSFKVAQKNVRRINTFCFYVLIFFLPMSVPPFGRDLSGRDYLLHCFLRNVNKVVLRSENVRDVVRKAVSSSQRNICRLKVHSLEQVFRCSFEDAPRGGGPASAGASSHRKGRSNGQPNCEPNGLRNCQPNRQPNGLPTRQPNSLAEALRDIHISARIEHVEEELAAYLRANAHFHETFFNIIVPMLNGLTTLLDSLEAIFALYVKYKVRKSRELIFFRNPWLCSYDAFLSFSRSGGPAPNRVEGGGVVSDSAGNLADDSADSLAAYMAQQDRQLAQDDLGALYSLKRVKEMLLLGGRKEGASRSNTGGGPKRSHLSERGRENQAKLNAYYSYILKLCLDERYKEINTRALRCLFCSLYFS